MTTTALVTTDHAEALRSPALTPPAEPVEREPRYHARSKYLPDPAQTYVSIPGVRNYRGSCGGCGASEDRFCPTSCVQTDPLDRHNVLRRLRTCHRCDVQVRSLAVDVVAKGTTLVCEGAPVVHLLLNGRKVSACGLVSVDQATEYLDVS